MITQRGLFPFLKPPMNCYVLAGEDGLVFDAGYGNRRAVRHFIAEFRRIERICRENGTPFNVRRITASHSHGDHFSGMRKLAEALGLEILLTRALAERITSEDRYRDAYEYDRDYDAMAGRGKLSKILLRLIHPLMIAYYRRLFGIDFVTGKYREIPDRGDITVNGRSWMVFPSPGHSEDHISLYDPENGILFAGDNVLRTVTTWLGPPRSDIGLYIRSLGEFQALPKLEIILSSHGNPVQNPAERIREIIRWRETRTGQVLRIILESGAGVTAREILKRLYPRGQAFKRYLSQGWVALTILHLEREGKIKRETRGTRVFFTGN